MRKKVVYRLLSLVILLFCLCVNSSARAGSVEEDVFEVEKNWVKAFYNADLELMSSLYWHSPETTEYTPNESFNGWDAIEANLKKYFELGKGTFDWKYFNTEVVILTDNMAIISGYHDMFEKPPGGNPYSLVLRFTLVLQKTNGKWLIVHNKETRVAAGSYRN
jgi:uncharacterized protein (TIGR02246 family)